MKIEDAQIVETEEVVQQDVNVVEVVPEVVEPGTGLDLVLAVETRVRNCNLDAFQEKATHFLSTLSSKFETDEDFTKAKEEIKTLKKVELATRTAVDKVLHGSDEIAMLLKNALLIADKFKQERLFREKLVKEKENRLKTDAIKIAEDEIYNLIDNLSDVKDEILEEFRFKIGERLNDAVKGKRTINSLQKAVSAEKTFLTSEIIAEANRLKERLAMLPIEEYSFLFKDKKVLVKSHDDLEPIIKERIDEYKKAQTQVQHSTPQQLQHNSVQPQPMHESVQPQVQPVTPPTNDGKVETFICTVPQTVLEFIGTLEEARAHFHVLKKYNIKGLTLKRKK